MTLPGGASARGGLDADQTTAMADAIAVLKEQGAVIVDPADIPSVVDADAGEQLPAVGHLRRRG